MKSILNELSWSQDIWNNIWSMVGAVAGVVGAYGIANWQMKKEKVYENESLLYKLVHDYLLLQFRLNTQELKELKDTAQFDAMQKKLDDELTIYFDILQQVKKLSKSFQKKHKADLEEIDALYFDMHISKNGLYSGNVGGWYNGF